MHDIREPRAPFVPNRRLRPLILVSAPEAWSHQPQRSWDVELVALGPATRLAASLRTIARSWLQEDKIAGSRVACLEETGAFEGKLSDAPLPPGDRWIVATATPLIPTRRPRSGTVPRLRSLIANTAFDLATLATQSWQRIPRDVARSWAEHVRNYVDAKWREVSVEAGPWQIVTYGQRSSASGAGNQPLTGLVGAWKVTNLTPEARSWLAAAVSWRVGQGAAAGFGHLRLWQLP